MESEVAEVPFSGHWNAMVEIARKPEELFLSFPYRARVFSSGERTLVSLSFKRLLARFDFDGVLEFTFGEPFATYVMKGERGLLILSFAAGDGTLLSRASADIPGERRLKGKLRFLALQSGKTVARMAESYESVAPRIVGSPLDFVLRDLDPSLLPHVIRYVRLKLAKPSFRLVGNGGSERFSISVENDVVSGIEHEGPNGSAIIEIGKDVLEVAKEDFQGVDVGGRYEVKAILPSSP